MIQAGLPKTGRAVLEPLALSPSVSQAIVRFAKSKNPAILESSLATHSYGRYCVLAADPIDSFFTANSDTTCAIESLAEKCATYPTVDARDKQIPFCGGWIGFLTYEAGLSIEKIDSRKPADLPYPLAQFFLYDCAAIFDHTEKQWLALAVEWPASLGIRRPSVKSRLASVQAMLEQAAETPAPEQKEPTVPTALIPNMTQSRYFAKVARAKQHIEAGDIYQVNLTQRFSGETELTPADLYLRLRETSPSPYAAFLHWDNIAVISSSPELFLKLRQNHVITRPIKGTRPRGGDAIMDRALRDELARSEKDRAELNMIIDLLRNDLGKVCKYDTVRVSEAGELEEHPTVFHRVATITGQLSPGKNWADLLLAAFPGGSITGAPKIRAMQIVEELESTPRGVYCGSIGVIGLDGSLDLNIAIRTIVQQGNAVHCHAGGAIVADSTAEQEYEECLAKVQGMLRALSGGIETTHSTNERVALC